MGFSVSWIGVLGRPKEEVFVDFGMEDSGAPDEGRVHMYDWAVSRKGWLIIQSHHEDFVTPGLLSTLSKGGEAVGVMVEEHVMFSGARSFKNGIEEWAVVHDAQQGDYHLEVKGEPPPRFKELRSKAMKDQDGQARVRKRDRVDFFFDVPPSLAASICGYWYEGGVGIRREPEFFALRRIGDAYVDASGQPRRPPAHDMSKGLWHWLFGGPVK